MLTRLNRRELLKAGGVAAGALAIGGPLAACGSSTSPRRERVAIVGAGLAGLACAYRLQELGIDAAVYEARPDRVGGRCYTARDFAEGQVGEYGGEFIDTDHRRLRKLVPELGLELEDRDAATRAQRGRLHGRRLFGGELLTVEEVYGDYPEFKRNLHRTGAETGYFRNYGYSGKAAARFDRRTALSYLEEAVPGGADTPLGLALQGYLSSEFGLDPSDLAATSVLYLLEGNAADKDGSDERFHVAGGNDQITTRLADELADGRLTMGAPLEALAELGDGGYSLQVGGGVGEVRAERVVLALPFSTLRDVELDDAGLSERKLEAIRELGMGTNSKVILQFDRRPGFYDRWNGALASDHPLQYTWDSTLTQKGSAGIVTVYLGGADGAQLEAPEPLGTAPEAVVQEMLGVLDEAAPGIGEGFDGRAFVANWAEDPWAKGSYAAFLPGQTTRFGRVAKQSEGGIHFAGEHTSTAYQGFLEGAVESGERAAKEVKAALEA